MNAEEMVRLLDHRCDDPAVESLRREVQAVEWPTRVAKSELRVCLSAKPSGVDLTFARSPVDFVLHAFGFWSKDYVKHGYTPFSGSLPRGLEFGQTHSAVVRLLGDPTRSRVEDGVIQSDTWIVDGVRILAQYSGGDHGLSSLEWARAPGAKA